MIRRIAGDLKLTIGSLVDTGYILPPMAEDDKKLIDIICKALDTTLIATHRNYVFFDDFGSLTLKNINDMKIDSVIGDKSLMLEYNYDRSLMTRRTTVLRLSKIIKKLKDAMSTSPKIVPT